MKSVCFTIVLGLFCLAGTASAAEGQQSRFDDVSLTVGPTAIEIPVVNGDFELLYKPGTTITGNVAVGGWTIGVGPDCPVNDTATMSYEFSDGTTGTVADIAGWIGYDREGWIAEGGTYDRDQTTGNYQGNVSFVDGNQMFAANGGDWGNPAGALIVSDASLGSVTDGTYILSMMATAPEGAATPIVLHLLANGVPLKPTASVDPALTDEWQQISRTYDAASLAGVLDQSLTIMLGVERQAGTSGLNPFLPISPKPENGAMDVKSTNRLLKWSPGRDHSAGYWDVYLGTDPDNLLLVADNKSFASKLYVRTAGFEAGQTYYWRVDPVGTDKTAMGSGDLWSFFVLPETANNPNPAAGAKNKLTDVELSWRAGANGDFHHVYFGTAKDAVANADKNSPEYQVRTVGTTTTFNPGELQRGTTYYWRVDEAKATGTEWKGTVWTFSTLAVLPILDPDLLGWWKLDEGSGNTAIDWSGHENHGEILYLEGGLGEDGAVWVDDPDHGTVLTFNGNEQTAALVKAGKIPAIGANDSFTWSFWARQKGDGTGEFETILGNRDVGVEYPRFIMFTPTKFEYFVNTGEYVTHHEAVEGLDYPDLEDGIWTHHALTKEGSSLTYYRNGIMTTQSGTAAEQGENAFYMGGDLAGGRWSGSMFNVKIYQRALSVEELASAMRRDPALAWDPKPSHLRVGDIDEIATLSWKPGDNAIAHDVYVGTEAQAVAQATPDTAGLYRGRQNSTVYTPDNVQMGQTYYWRIDQISGDQSTSTGDVWRFTVADYLIVDDFEFYNDLEPEEPGSNRIYFTWIDGVETPATNGSQVGYWDPPFAEQTIAHDSSRQSMPLSYNNSTAGTSEATATVADLPIGPDWTRHGMKELSLWFRGDLTNTAEGMYLAINDSVVDHDNPEAIRITEWTEWVIPLQAFLDQGVNLTKVNTVTIGMGTQDGPATGSSGLMFFDNFRLYQDAHVDL